MNDFIEQLKAVGREVRLDVTRKQSIRNRVVQAMHERPVRVRTSWWLLRSVQLATACVVFILASGITTAYAANQALPGEILYPIKININEAVAAAFKRSPEQKAAYEVQRASKRLEEVDQLALNQKLDLGTRHAVEQNLDRQVERAQKTIDQIETAGNTVAATELQSGLTAVLAAHEQIIDSLQQQKGNNNQELEAVKQNVRATLKRRNEIQKKDSNSAATQTGEAGNDSTAQSVGNDENKAPQQAERFKVAAEAMIARATAVLTAVPEGSRTKSEEIRRAEALLATARQAYDRTDYAKALSSAKAALLTIQESNVLDRVNQHLKLDVKIRHNIPGEAD